MSKKVKWRQADVWKWRQALLVSVLIKCSKTIFFLASKYGNISIWDEETNRWDKSQKKTFREWRLAPEVSYFLDQKSFSWIPSPTGFADRQLFWCAKNFLMIFCCCCLKVKLRNYSLKTECVCWVNSWNLPY